MLCEAVSGEEAERIGLVSLAVEEGELLAKAYGEADRAIKLLTASFPW